MSEKLSLKPKLVFLGGGNMAEAIFSKLGQDDDFEIIVIQRNPEKAARLSQLYPIAVKSKLDCELSSTDILILAIKPQQAKEACLALEGLANHCTVVSLMAGLTISRLEQWLKNPQIIRSMPNTPASIGLGVTAIYFPAQIDLTTRAQVEKIFAQVGINAILSEEDGINKALPISSSAIAFVYYFMEGLIDNAVSQFGLSQQNAQEIIMQVVAGSLGLLKAHPDLPISQQRAMVTSKKGTTERGLQTLSEEHFHQIIGKAMKDCYLRGLELAGEN